MIGDRILLGRKKMGYSQRDLAAKIGTSAMAVSKFERNLITPRSGTLARIAGALDVSLEFLMDSDRDPMTAEITHVVMARDIP